MKGCFLGTKSGNVIIVGHSYGVMVIIGVADRAAARIGHRVYFDAAYPPQGESLLEHAAAIGPTRQLNRIINGVEIVMPPEMMGGSLWHHRSGANRLDQNASHRPAVKCFEQPGVP
jgi:hypothetical protein